MLGSDSINLNTVQVLQVKHIENQAGVFIKNFDKNNYERYGLNFDVSEDYFIVSHRNVLRGIHMQWPNPQKRLVSVIQGKFQLITVDLRKNLETFGESESFNLEAENPHLVYIPEGFGIGTLALLDNSIIHVMSSGTYIEENGVGVCYNDKDLKIPWNSTSNPIVSDKDKNLLTLKEFKKRL